MTPGTASALSLAHWLATLAPCTLVPLLRPRTCRHTATVHPNLARESLYGWSVNDRSLPNVPRHHVQRVQPVSV